MSVSSEISRLQGAKATLKTKLNAVNKSTDQITDETLDEYGDYVDTVGTNITTALTTLNTDLTGDSIYKMIAVGKGSNVTLNDTEEESLDDFKILGKTVQNGTPSPSNPVAIENVCGKNIFDESQFLQATDWTKNSSGYYTGTVQNLYNKFNAGFSNTISFKPNTRYTISYSGYVSATNVNARIKIFYTDGSTTDIGDLYINKTTDNTYSYTTASGKTIQKLAFNYSNGGTVYIKNIQVEEGTSKTDFQPFNTVKIKRTDGTSEETYNFPLGDTVLMEGDYIDKLGIHHIRKQEVKSGTSVTLSDAKTNGKYVCTHKSSGNLSNQTLSFGSSVTDATIEYELATPTITPFTSAQQAVFNEILQDGTYEVVTTYTSEGNLAPDMEINYHKDLQPRLSQTIEDVTDILG